MAALVVRVAGGVARQRKMQRMVVVMRRWQRRVVEMAWWMTLMNGGRAATPAWPRRRPEVERERDRESKVSWS